MKNCSETDCLPIKYIGPLIATFNTGVLENKKKCIDLVLKCKMRNEPFNRCLTNLKPTQIAPNLDQTCIYMFDQEIETDNIDIEKAVKDGKLWTKISCKQNEQFKITIYNDQSGPYIGRIFVEFVIAQYNDWYHPHCNKRYAILAYWNHDQLYPIVVQNPYRIAENYYNNNLKPCEIKEFVETSAHQYAFCKLKMLTSITVQVGEIYAVKGNVGLLKFDKNPYIRAKCYPNFKKDLTLIHIIATRHGLHPLEPLSCTSHKLHSKSMLNYYQWQVHFIKCCKQKNVQKRKILIVNPKYFQAHLSLI